MAAPLVARAQVYVRRANIFPWLLGVAIACFLAASLSAFLVVSDQSDKGQLLPSALTTTLLVGMLVPAMAILMLIGRLLALRRAAASIGSKGRLHVQLVFLFSMIAAVPTLLVVIFASFLFQSGVEFWFSDNSRGMLENANKLAQGYYEQSRRDVSTMPSPWPMMCATPWARSRWSAVNSRKAFPIRCSSASWTRWRASKGPDGHLNTAAFVDPSGKPRDWVTPEELRRIDAGEPIVVNANADRIEAVTPIDRRTGSISLPRAGPTFWRSARASVPRTSCVPIRC
jgi:two-component system nitrogen regulation sensor histidine kinase NtrY